MYKKLLLSAMALVLSVSYMVAQNVNVTFTVENPDSTPVFVFGSWSGWGNWPGDELFPIGNNQYSRTLSIPANTQFEYLYVASAANPTKEVLDPTWTCTNGNAQYTNRLVTAVTADTMITDVWAQCAAGVNPVKVTFGVSEADSSQVNIAGSWNGWVNWPGNMMNSLGNGEFELDMMLAANTTFEYLYVGGVDAANSQKEVLNPAWPCTNGNGQYTNRVITTGTMDMNSCHKFALCDTCGAISYPDLNVTFQVQNPADSVPYVFGSWTGWSDYPGTMMTNIGNDTWEAMITIPANQAIEYKFLYVNGTDTTFELLDSTASCTNGNPQYTNRVANLDTVDVTLCNIWATCDACIPDGVHQIISTDLGLAINANGIKINSTNITKFEGVEVYDITGRNIFSTTNVEANRLIPVKLNEGMVYLIKVRSGDKYQTFKGILH